MMPDFPTSLQNLCYAIASVVFIVGVIQTYVDMNNEPHTVKRTIITTVVAIVSLIAVAMIIQTI